MHICSLEKMEIKRFFVPTENITDDIVTITGDEHIHLSNVLRFKKGYKLIVCDNSGYDYNCTVLSIEKDKTTCKIESNKLNQTEHASKIILLYGLTKSEKYEIGIQKAVELGVNEIVPFISQNTSEKSLRLDRLNRIVLEACKQCGRAKRPIVHEPLLYQNALNFAKGLKIIAYEKEYNNTLRTVLTDLHSYDCVTLAIGSEGGLTVEEIEKAKSLGFTSVSLGKRILRAETAVISGLASISLFMED